MTQVSKILEGVRVVAIEHYISAPYCTEIFAELGAEVIKVERPGAGDPRRHYEPTVEVGRSDVSGGFASYNRGKRSVELDLRDAVDLEKLHHFLERADVLVSNLRPGALSRSGLDPDLLREKHPRLVVCEITGFGVTGGPYSEWSAFDSVIQGMSGFASLIGADASAPPGLAPMSTMDLLAGIWAALGCLAALVQRGVTGVGSHVDTAMYDVGVAFVERALTLHEFTEHVPVRGSDAFSPVGTFCAVDGGWLSIVMPTDEMWERLCRAIERSDLVIDPDLNSVAGRAACMNSRVLPALEDWTRRTGLTAEETAARLQRAGIPVGIVQSIDEVRNCAHLAHREMFAPLLSAGDGAASRWALPRVPLLFDGAASRPGAVPDLGEGNGLVDGAANTMDT